MPPPPDSSATLSRVEQRDAVRVRFEDAWRVGSRPRLEAYLELVPPADRAGLLGELLTVEWGHRVKSGDSFYQDEYARRFADHAAEVAAAWERWEKPHPSGDTTLAPSGKTLPPAFGPGSLLPALPGYEKVERIGEGGMGEVFRAWDARLARWVALKRIHLARESPERLARFRTEAAALAKMRHPHVVGVHAFLEDAGQPVLVMEYVTNGTLSDRLREETPLPPADAARLVAVLAWAVHAAHEAGVVHRDLKPDNVLMADPVPGSPGNVLGGSPKVTDFGLAALADAPGGPTLEGAIFGTPAYMAPEQAAGRTREVGPASDVWALGVILYRCLTGRVPFEGDSVMETLDRVRAMRFEAPRKVVAGVPVELEAICLACLQKEPSSRPTAKDLAERLTRFASGEADTTVLSPRPISRRWGRIAAIVVAASVFAVVLGVGGWWLSQRPKNGQSVRQGPAEEAVHIAPSVKLRVLHYEREGGKDVPVGVIGKDSPEARYRDRVVLDVETSTPAYCYLIGFNFDGGEQLLWPCDEAKAPHAGDMTQSPPQRSRFQYPPKDARTGKLRGLSLDDDARGGLQAFLVVASSQPLPPYREWRAQRGKSPWGRRPAAAGVWRSDGETLDAVLEGDVRPRGSVVELEGQPPLLQLSGWARGEGVDGVEAIAFPVRGE